MFRFLLVVSRRQHQLRYISNKTDENKNLSFLKFWKLWPVPYLLREKPKQLTLYEKLTSAFYLQTLVERLLTGGIAMLALFTLYYGTHVSDTPVTHRKRFVIFNTNILNEISDEVFNMYVLDHKSTILSSRNARYKLVERVANKLVQSNLDIPEVLSKDWTVTIVNEPSYNVFVLPTGQILVYEGMLSLCKSDDQLAAVLGHELAHAILGHTAELANNLGMWDKVWMTGAMVLWSIVPFAHQSVSHFMATKMKMLFLNLPYNQLLEQEADKVGLQMLAKACFDVRESSAFWGKMEVIQRMNYEDKIEWLSIHPDVNRRRSKVVDKFLPEALRIRAENKCPPLSKTDPRENIAVFREEFEQRMAHEPHVIQGKFENEGPQKRVKVQVDRVGGFKMQKHVHGDIQTVETHAASQQVRGEIHSHSAEQVHDHHHHHQGQVKGEIHPHTHAHEHDHEHAPDYSHGESPEPKKPHAHNMFVHEDHYHRHNERTPIDKRL